MDSLEQWLSCAIGRELVSVLAQVYCYEGKKDHAHPQSLDIAFSDTHGKIECATDGASLAWSQEALSQIDMAEYGTEVIDDLSEDIHWRSAIGRKLKNARLVTSALDKLTVGIQLKFEGGTTVSILNLGDEISLFGEIPRDIFHDEKLDFIDVSPA